MVPGRTINKWHVTHFSLAVALAKFDGPKWDTAWKGLELLLEYGCLGNLLKDAPLIRQDRVSFLAPWQLQHPCLNQSLADLKIVKGVDI